VPRPDPPSARLPPWSWLAVWGALVGLALALRPILPVDETRYLSVAWEMWLRGDWLVPYLNGAPYSDKPPLLFWGILLGWRVLGVNQWWPRLLPPLFGLIGALLLVRLTGRLRPGPERRALPFLSGLLWVTFSTLLLFDTLLTTCVLVALAGVVEAWRGRTLRGWVACGVGIGLGVLAKGPVVLVHVLPAALLAPWWGGVHQQGSWPRWYLGLAAAVGLGAAIGLAWALPAAARGGPDYASAILWEQTAGRIAGRLAHDRPWWWYLPLLPLVLYPWALWPPLWRSPARGGRNPVPAGVPARLALAWVVPGLVALSSFGGKQIHYLMPLLPGFALLAAEVCSDVEPHRWDAAAPAGAVALVGILLGAGAGLQHALGLPGWLGEVPPAWGLVLLAGALVLARSRGAQGQVLALSLTSPALMLVVHLAGSRALARRYDLRPVAGLLEAGEQAARPIAFVGHYAGQFHFLGRLVRPIEDVPRSEVAAWKGRHPDGLVVRQVGSAADTAGALLARPYGEGMVGVWPAVRAR